eukprot:CAMPEP_0197240252 /NCGR_PEP_ID=MMETSP1429-20130617/6576_1 /TAXON_ID=49237 /ORGANISM="Chaetoceros  sp., Strain UNC1202" /LENGTH=407 /DNA_ID=CAMNT_0042699851 /DNA_START=1 /DNA_END=1224 /DNA_ORIENTATION=+
MNYPWLPHNTDPSNNPTPTEHQNVAPQILGNRQQFYENYMQGCRDFWTDKGKDGRVCDENDEERITHNQHQAHSMVNFTDVGYKKIKAPENVYNMLLDFWNENKDKEEDESWFVGNAFVNYWESQSKMVDVQNHDLKGGGTKLMDAIWDTSVSTISEWTGMDLVPSSLYGIRVYKENAVLNCHVDRLPLISSAIINVAQDVDEPWPLEVIGHDGKAKNITMEPGDMVLYESHSVVHGRPFPLKGRYYANVFIHFEPHPAKSMHDEHDLPAYIQEGSIEAQRYRDGEYDGEIPSPAAMKILNKDDLKNKAHDAAGEGDLDALIEHAKEDMALLHQPDKNGWQPIHEGSRSGSLEVVEFLAAQGVDVNARTHDGTGYSPLAIVEREWGDEHPLYEFLSSLGAFEAGPEF